MLNKDEQRELAYVVTIDNITPIPGYDRVELAYVGGWTIVVGKGEFQPGDPAIYFEIDSKLPEVEPFTKMEFLVTKHYKIKTQRMCKCISQGLLMSAENFGWDKGIKYIKDSDGVFHSCNDESRFLTKQLGVTYAVQEDNERKSSDPNAKYKSMAARHPGLFQKKPIRWLYKKEWGKKLLFLFFGKKKDNNNFPTQFQYVKRTDEDRCIVGNTKILTANGYIRIADIVKNKLQTAVYTYNIKTNKIELKNVIGYQDNGFEHILNIKYKKHMFAKVTPHSSNATSSIQCTYDHKILTSSGYKEAKDVLLTDKLLYYFNCYSADILPFLYGTLLGDSNIQFDKRNDRFDIRIKITHGEKQLGYLKEKLRILGVPNNPIQVGYSGYKPDAKIYSSTLPKDEFIIQALANDQCIADGHFQITKQFCDRLTIESLAWWFLDDGSIRNKDYSGTLSITFSTYSFSYDEVQLLANVLKKFGYNPKIRSENQKNKDGVWYTISLLKEDTIKFVNDIKDYVPECMKYKLLVDTKSNYCLRNLSFIKNDCILPVDIISIEDGGIKHVYDITVEDNHNFISNGLVSHNCENMSWILSDKRIFLSSEKVDGTSSTYLLSCHKGMFKTTYEFYVCSRNRRIFKPDQETYHEQAGGRKTEFNVYWDNAFKYDIKQHLKDYLIKNNLDYVCIQGESVGPDIQGNPLKLPETDLYVFNFIRSDIGRISSIKGKDIIESWGMKWVPLLDLAFRCPDTMEEMKTLADGKSKINPVVDREGIVYSEPIDGNVIHFKNVSNKYLLKQKDGE